MNEPCTIAAPEEDSPKVISLTMVFSSTTVPHETQNVAPDAASDSIRLLPCH